MPLWFDGNKDMKLTRNGCFHIIVIIVSLFSSNIATFSFGFWFAMMWLFQWTQLRGIYFALVILETRKRKGMVGDTTRTWRLVAFKNTMVGLGQCSQLKKKHLILIIIFIPIPLVLCHCFTLFKFYRFLK